MMFRYKNCDHITWMIRIAIRCANKNWSKYNCKCNVEFCYKCDVKWKKCLCDDWMSKLFNQKTQLIVDKKTSLFLTFVIRQQRMITMKQKLQTNYECNHNDKFIKFEESRDDKICEMCDTKHRKYILFCKRCHILICENCRRHKL